MYAHEIITTKIVSHSLIKKQNLIIFIYMGDIALYKFWRHIL